jgi:hypothetical protein
MREEPLQRWTDPTREFSDGGMHKGSDVPLVYTSLAVTYLVCVRYVKFRNR